MDTQTHVDDDRSAAELAAAAEAYERATERVESAGESSLSTLADALSSVDTLFDTYESRATGTGDFRAYVEFQNELTALVEGLPDELPGREAFETASSSFEKRRLDEGDFERARELLADARALAARLDDRDEALTSYRSARRAVEERLDAVEAWIDDLDRLAELGDADLDAPIDDLREPIAAYNDAVEDAFDGFLDEASAREVLAFVETTRRYPLVQFETPPDALREYVTAYEAGELSIPELLAYAGYSRSKLDHYVAEPEALVRAVATDRTYLERLGPGPVRIDWPPPPASVCRFRVRELVSVVDRFAPSAVVESLRAVRALTRDADRYERLRNAAVAAEELDDGERERLASGAVEREREALVEERERLAQALASHPRR